MKLTRPALVAGAAATILACVPVTAASAQTVLHLDQTHDVWSVNLDDAMTTSAPTYTREPTVAEADVQAIRVTHARRTVTVTVKYRELAKIPVTADVDTVAGHEFLLRTNTGERRGVAILAEPGAWYGRQSMRTYRGGAVHCSGMRHSIDYVKNKVTLSVPRSCLGNPRWVQVAEITFEAKGAPGDATTGASSSTATEYLDDAYSPYVTGHIHYSPKVHRG